MNKIFDIHGIEIKVGDIVKSTQPSGGIFNPAPPSTGIVVIKEFCGTDSMVIEYDKNYRGSLIKCYILLEGKINEIIN